MIGYRIALVGLGLIVAVPDLLSAKELPPFSAVKEVIERQIDEYPDLKKNDLISKRFAVPIFAELKKLGWKVADEKEITQLMLADGHPLVGTFESTDGYKFMRKVSSYKLIYDRLDRISEVSGGKRLIQDLVKLPDGQRYAKAKPARGAPDLLDFLPKERNGKKRRIKDYEKPTGRIYTVEQFVARLKVSYEKAKKPAAPSRP